jgi:hypothetical protein
MAEVCVAAVLPQIQAVGGELIVADGHGSGLDPALGSDVVWLREPGAARLTLHARALAIAPGALVAITEDHVRPDPDWCEAMLRAHRERPDVDVIVGAIRNGSRRRVSDRASFLLTSAPYAPPLQELPRRSPPFNNLSLKRRVLPATPTPGELEFDLVPRLFAAGRVDVDGRVTAVHIQDLSILQALVLHFHNGRMHGGSFANEPPPRRRRRARDALRVPQRLTAETAEELARRPASSYGRRDAAGVALIATAHTLGLLAGLALGAGHSAQHVN